MADRWYRDGLSFECTECGACCSGEPGYVWVNKDEVQALASSLQMDVESFRDKFVRRVGSRFSLIEYSDGDCIFFRSKNAGLFGLRSTTDAMPNLAVLELQSQDREDLGRDLRGLSRGRARKALFDRANRSSTGQKEGLKRS